MIEYGTQYEDMTPEAQARMRKYGSTLDAYNVAKVIERIEDYPEIIAAVTALPMRPEFDPELGGD